MAFECSNTVLYVQLIDFSHVLGLITRENCSFTAMFFSLSPWNLTKESHNTLYVFYIYIDFYPESLSIWLKDTGSGVTRHQRKCCDCNWNACKFLIKVCTLNCGTLDQGFHPPPLLDSKESNVICALL